MTNPPAAHVPATDPGAVEITTADAVPTAVVRVTNYPMSNMRELFDSAFQAIFPALAERGLAPVGAPFSLHTRMPTETVDMEVGVPISGNFGDDVAAGDVVVSASELPAGDIARTSYVGPYDGLGEAWGTFMGSVMGTGRAPAFPFWEVYVTEPSPAADPATLRTDLVTSLT